MLTLACAEMDARPLFWNDPDGTRYGYEPEAAAAVAARMGLGLRWEFRIWSAFRAALEAGEVDAIWCGSAITPERRAVFDYSRPYAVFGEGVLVRRGEGIAGPADLRGLRVGAIAASTNMALAESWPGVGELVEFDGSSDDVFAEMVAALRARRIDALVDDEPAFGAFDEGDLELGFVVATENAWGAALRPGSDALRAALDEAIAAVVADGTLAGIWSRWFPRTRFPL
jgi:polar amino acid transport system substrate-binding protein